MRENSRKAREVGKEGEGNPYKKQREEIFEFNKMHRALSLKEKLSGMSIFANVPFLNQYDGHTLDCASPLFSFHLLKCISNLKLPWTGAATGNSRTKIRVHAEGLEERAALVQFFRDGQHRLQRNLAFPLLFSVVEPVESKGSCAFEAGLSQATVELLGASQQFSKPHLSPDIF